MSLTAAIPSASDIQMDYMKLLVTQLRYQNPLEPLNNNEMASQLAQLSQLQQLESMNSRFAQVLANIERTYASSLIGKEVSYIKNGDSDSNEIETGTVEKVINDFDGKVAVVIDGHTVTLENIVSVED